ncbi:hypothetical protein ABOONEI_2489, partial [Aciduliprofundum boonei T469]
MKRITALLVITLLASSFLFSFAAAEYDNGGTTGPTPGTYEIYKPCYKYVAGTQIREDWIGFVNNDAYESGLVQEPYEFFASIWGGYNNQRVAVSFFLNYAHVYGGQVNVNQNAHFTILQKKEWASEWHDENHTVHMMNVSASFTAGSLTTNGTEENGYYANTSFLTSSSDFYPGIFEIDVQVSNNQAQAYTTVAKIWGIFTPGKADVKDVHDASYWKPGEQPYTSITVAFSEGSWNVKLWYGDKTPPVSVEKGQVNKSANPNAYIVKDFGNYSGTTTTLRYNFTSSDPAGVYVWIITSSWGSSLLTSYTWTVS